MEKGFQWEWKGLIISVGGDVGFGVLMRVRLQEGIDFGCEGVDWAVLGRLD